MELTQKDQLLEIYPGVAVRLTHHVREIERLTATNQGLQRAYQPIGTEIPHGDSARAKESEQIFSSRCQSKQAEASSEAAANLLFHE